MMLGPMCGGGVVSMLGGGGSASGSGSGCDSSCAAERIAALHISGSGGVGTPSICPHGNVYGGVPTPPPPAQPLMSGGMRGSHMSLCTSDHYRLVGGVAVPPPPVPPPPLFNGCAANSFNTMPTSSRWGPRTSCPVHSPFRVRVPNGSICSGHQVINTTAFSGLFIYAEWLINWLYIYLIAISLYTCRMWSKLY